MTNPWDRDIDVPEEVLADYTGRDLGTRDEDQDQEAAAPANVFELPGLPAYTALAENVGAVDDAKPVPVPEVETDKFTGDWDAWVDPAAGADASTSATETSSASGTGKWVVPDYDDPVAMAAFRDRTGDSAGAGVRRLPDQRVRVGGSGPRWLRGLLGAAALAGVVGVVGVVVWVNVRAAERGQTVPGAADASAGAVSPAAATAASGMWEHATGTCRRTVTESVVIGADPGDTGSGPGVIQAIEWAYYVDRSATAVRALTTPDALVPDAGTIQAGIDSYPAGVRYCVTITAADTDGRRWDVQIQQQKPGEDEPSIIDQVITTTTGPDGRTLVTGIRPR
ncbi:hypothetical protein [Nocardia paucivorans]|uniref:hypothetical protein n=1 Tax=Nocardia paucivorans TaxID=114259 RepID=UPI00030C15E4|nr:hypothetical protein [Nocardia paucivorans]